MTNLKPAKPGEGITWEPGTLVWLHNPGGRRHRSAAVTVPVELATIGRRWATIVPTPGVDVPRYVITERFDMGTGLIDGHNQSWSTWSLWASVDAIRFAAERAGKEQDLADWARNLYASRVSCWSTADIDDLHALLVRMGHIDKKAP